MSNAEHSVEVEVPVRTAYDQWAQFESFPRFMEGVESVAQRDDFYLHWMAKVGGVRREWDAEVIEQIPDERLAWQATEGARDAGVVTFHRLGEGRCKVMLQLDIEADGATEADGDALGMVRRRAEGNLERFKAFIEQQCTEPGAWRGEVPPRLS